MDARSGAGSTQGNVEAAGKSVATKLEGPKSEGAKSDGPKSEGPWTVRKLLGWIAGFLKDREVDSPRHVAEVLLADVLKVERLKLYMEPDRELAGDELAALRALVARAGRHEPVQFLVGRWTFFGRDFKVAPCTLIPRPCTETLVERALEWYRARHAERGAGAVRVLDLCTGTGCIAVSIALGMKAIARPSNAGCKPLRGERAAVDALPTISIGEEPAAAAAAVTAETAAGDISVVATDVVREAVELARDNARQLGVAIDVRAGDLWGALAQGERFDLIVSNPPYVTDAEYAALDRNVREYEPASALRGGADGLDFVRRIVDGAAERIAPGGMLLIEIGWKHGDAARALVSGAVHGKSWEQVDVLKDGDGIDRVLVAVRRGG
jgi:release factor glutamine methyltransferase